MINSQTIKQLAEENPTNKVVLNELKEYERFRKTLNLNRLHYNLIRSGQQVANDQYLNFFRKLQQLGAGKLVFGRRGNPTRFMWGYDIREATNTAFGNEPIKEAHSVVKEEFKVIKRKRGRPAKIRTTSKAPNSPISITFNISPKASKEDLAALLALAKELESK